MNEWNCLECDNSHGLTDVSGFQLSGIASDVRQNGDGRLDLGILYSPTPCRVAGVFTRNRVRAAPVVFDEEVLSSGSVVHGVVANSGNANACTGEEGMRNARRMASMSEQVVNAPEGSFLVCSTGRIGRQLPMSAVEEGIRLAGESLGVEGSDGLDFANCILTSDTRNKKISVQVTDGVQTVHISGVAKGAGMIRPDMATMLAFIATDLGIEQGELKEILVEATELSFNAITVDGDMSTNDTVLCFANGHSSIDWRAASASFKQAFREGLLRVCEYLAYLIVGDGEKITKVVTIHVRGAESVEDAKKVAYSIAHSPLVKSSWAGSDPNWGRVIAATGYSGVPVFEEKLCMKYNDVPVVENGKPLDQFLEQWKTVVALKQFEIEVSLGMGNVDTRLIASDLTPEYITFNMKE